jgi:hypothetical protein
MMAGEDILHQRLLSQHIAGARFEKTADVVMWMGAVQAQDYLAAKWAVAARTKGISDAAVEQAFADGVILRTHLLRPTWHFVTPDDIRWILTLTAPRIHAANAYWYRRVELDETVFNWSNTALANALRGGNQLTRPETESVLHQAGISTKLPLRFAYLMMHAELDGIVCSGVRQGKQHTYALLDERAPQARKLEREDALAELSKRYFISHGPTTLEDYIWWSGLSSSDAKAGLGMVESQLDREAIDGRTYWFAASTPMSSINLPTTYLLPNFDEYLVGYTDRSAIFDKVHLQKLDARGSILANHTIVIDGKVAGIWRRTIKKNAVIIELSPFIPLTEAEERSVAAAADRYGDFLNLPVVLA